MRFNTKHYLSIVIPTHGRQAAVAEVIRRLAVQDLDREFFEVLVVSNFAEPGLETALGEWRTQTGLTIRSFTAGRLGVNAARNLGIKNASGEYVLLLDDDCFPADRGYLTRLLKLHEEFPSHVALGGGYLSLPELNPAGRHYNWICNQWLGAQFAVEQEARRLIGGAVSYKLGPLRQHGLKFSEDIQYGGTETEFHQRLVSLGFRLLYHPRLSVIHNPEMSNYDLVRKAYLQGYGKGLRPVIQEPPRAESFWDDWLKSTFQFNLYRKSFARGVKRAQRAKPRAPQWQIALLYFCLSVIFGLQRDPRLRKLLLHWHHLLHVYYWRLYHVASETYGLSRRAAGFVKGRIMRTYGLMMRGYGWSMRVYGHSTGYVHAKSIRTYWTLYPVFYHLRRNWSEPWTLLDETKMPFTYPDLDLRARPLWTAEIDGRWTPERLHARLEKYRRLGIVSVELEGMEPSAAAAIAEHGMKYHFVLKPFANAALDRFPAGTEFIVSVSTLELGDQLDALTRWVKSLPGKFSLHLKIDALPPSGAVKKFLSAVRASGRVEHYSFQMPKASAASVRLGFEYFRWLHRFADQVKDFDISWRALYRYQENELYDLPALAHPSRAPEVSVIIPHHRDFGNLTPVLRALALQEAGTPPFEVVVVDNAVEEHLLTGAQQAEVFHAAAGLDLKFHQLRSESAGHYLSGNARNFGIINSSGKKILFLDSDILVPRDFIAGVAEGLQTRDVLMAKRAMLGEDFEPGKQSVEEIEAHQTYREDDYWEGYKRANQWTDLVDYWKYSCTYCLAVTRENLLRAGPFDPQFMMYGFEDVDLGFRLFKNGLRFSFLDRKVYHLYPRKELHNYHHDSTKRMAALSRSALTFFLLRPEKLPFALCQGYFAPTFRNWVKQPFRRIRDFTLGRRPEAECAVKT